MLVCGNDDVGPGNVTGMVDGEIFEEIGDQAEFAVWCEYVFEDGEAFVGFEEG